MPALRLACRAEWRTGRAHHAAERVHWHDGAPVPAGLRLAWRVGAALQGITGTPWSRRPAHDGGQRLAWCFGRGRAVAQRTPWIWHPAADAGVRLPWRPAVVVAPLGTYSGWARGVPVDVARRLPWAWLAGWPGAAARIPWARGLAADAAWRLPWARGVQQRQYGPRLPWGVEPDPPPGGAVVVIPLQRVYVMTNSVEVVRLPDLVPIPCSAVSIAVDQDSYLWEARLTVLGADGYAALAPGSGGPVDVRVTINGHAWVVMVAGRERGLQFGTSTYSVIARSRAAYLGVPHTATRSFTELADRTAQQLAADELGFSGWALDWQLADWLVPGGVYTYADGAPIDQISRIASAAGGTVRAARAVDELIVAPRYPAPWWEWSSAEPAYSLPTAVITRLADRWEDRPEWNAVYLAGQAGGRAGRVKRAGTAGDVLAPSITDPLLTHVDAIRARGIEALSRGGRQQRVTLEVPLMAPPGALGLIEPGQLVEVTGDGPDWRGLVMATRISAGKAGDALRVRQALEIERHHE